MNDTRTKAKTLKATMRTNGELLFRAADVARAIVTSGGMTSYSADSRGPDAEHVRAVVRTLGTGKKVEVTTAHGEKWRATIRSMEADGFWIVRGLRHTDTYVPYSTATGVKAAGLSTGAQIGIAAGAATGALVLWGLVAVSRGN